MTPNLVLQWNAVMLDAIRALGHLSESNPNRGRGGPPQVARSIAIVYAAAYDAWAAYDDVAKPAYATAIARRPAAERLDTNRRRAISRAIQVALVDQFPVDGFEGEFRARYEASIKALLAQDGIDPELDIGSGQAATSLGRQAAQAVLAFRHSDGSNQAGYYADPGPTPYVPHNRPMFALMPASIDAIDDVGHWQPLAYLNPSFESRSPGFIAPHWGKVKSFAIGDDAASRDALMPAPPQPVERQGFLDQAKHVVDVQAGLTAQQKVIAEYWADGPNSELPPGHWTLMAAYALQTHPKQAGLGDTVKLYFALGAAILDASIATWDAKRRFDYVRPVTAIRHLFRGKRIRSWGGPGRGTVEIDGAAWRPFQADVFPTPPFAEYTSGHSAFSMAAATVLKTFFESDVFGFYYVQTTPLRADPAENVVGTVLNWPTFTSAAIEAGESRLYGGIHFYEGNVAGLALGVKCGQAAWDKAKRLWTGAP